MVARGYASLSFLYYAAESITEIDKTTFMYHLGRFRSSGINAGEKIEETLRELAPDADIYFERTAVTPKQIWKLGVADSATKATDTRAKGFGEISVELDAVEPDMVRQLVEHALEVHLPADQYDVLKIAEEASGPSCAASRRSGAPKTWP